MSIETGRPYERANQVALYALCVSVFMTALDATVVTIAIPAIQASLQASLNDMVWVTSAYILCFAVLSIGSGRLGDRFGPKPVLLVGLAMFTMASLACALAPNPQLLIAARVAQGVAAALMTPQTMTLIVRLFPPQQRSRALGIWGAVGAAAMAAGPLIGGLTVAILGWRTIFLINIPVGIAGWFAAARLVPDHRTHRPPRLDLLGVALIAAGLFALLFAVQSGESYDWGTIAGPVSIGVVAAAGAVCLLAFVVWQHRNPREPLLPLRLFADRNFSAASSAGAAMGASLCGLFLALMIYLQTTSGYSAVQAGIATVPMYVVSSWSARAAGRASERIRPSVLAGAGFGALTAAIAVLAWLLHPGVSLWLLQIPLLVAGLGIGAVSATLAGIATHDLSPELVGAASGAFNTIRLIGSALGGAVTGLLLQAGIGATTTTATKAALMFPIAMVILGIGCCAFIRTPRGADLRYKGRAGASHLM